MASPSRTSHLRVLASGPKTSRQYLGVERYLGSRRMVRSILGGAAADTGAGEQSSAGSRAVSTQVLRSMVVCITRGSRNHCGDTGGPLPPSAGGTTQCHRQKKGMKE